MTKATLTIENLSYEELVAITAAVIYQYGSDNEALADKVETAAVKCVAENWPEALKATGNA